MRLAAWIRLLAQPIHTVAEGALLYGPRLPKRKVRRLQHPCGRGGLRTPRPDGARVSGKLVGRCATSWGRSRRPVSRRRHRCARLWRLVEAACRSKLTTWLDRRRLPGGGGRAGRRQGDTGRSRLGRADRVERGAGRSRSGSRPLPACRSRTWAAASSRSSKSSARCSPTTACSSTWSISRTRASPKPSSKPTCAIDPRILLRLVGDKRRGLARGQEARRRLLTGMIDPAASPLG